MEHEGCLKIATYDFMILEREQDKAVRVLLEKRFFGFQLFDRLWDLWLFQRLLYICDWCLSGLQLRLEDGLGSRWHVFLVLDVEVEFLDGAVFDLEVLKACCRLRVSSY